LSIDATSVSALGIKGCILAEDGIETRSETKILLAKEIFEKLYKKHNEWRYLYNLANTLSALEKHKEAKKYYLRALKLNSEILSIWKNLATCYYYSGNHKKEIDKGISAILKMLNKSTKLHADIQANDIHQLNISYEDLILLVDNLYLYCSFRDFIHLSEYFESFQCKNDLEKIYWFGWGITFSKILRIFSIYPRLNKSNLKKIYDKSRSLFENILPLAIKGILISYSNATKNEKVLIMSNIIANLPLTVLLEFSRGLGYLMGVMKADTNKMDRIISESSDINDWPELLAGKVLLAANKELKLLREE